MSVGLLYRVVHTHLLVWILTVVSRKLTSILYSRGKFDCMVYIIKVINQYHESKP